METDDPNEAASTGTSTRQSAGKSAKVIYTLLKSY